MTVTDIPALLNMCDRCARVRVCVRVHVRVRVCVHVHVRVRVCVCDGRSSPAKYM